MEYYPRKIEEKMDKWIKRPEILIVKGPRQAGKTTLLLHLAEKLGGKYASLEDEDFKNSLERDPKSFARRFMEGRKTVLLLDEAQYLRDVGKRLKLIYDLYSDRLKLIVTGSGSFDVKVEVGKYLVGRAAYFELLPLSFEEFLMWKARDLHKLFADRKKEIVEFVKTGKRPDISVVFEREFRELLEEYLLFGGYPAVVKEDDREMKTELLRNLARTYLEKDVFFFFDVRHLETFNSFMKYLAVANGALLNVSSVMRELGMDYKTVRHYLSVLQHTYVITRVAPFHRNRATELKKAAKVYFVDTGLRNSIAGGFAPLETRVDRGVLLENFILNELRALGEVRYWRTTGKAEVDFVLQLEGDIVPVEVKTEARAGRGFLSFIQSYRPARALVFTLREFGVRRIGGTQVLMVPHFFV